MDDPHSGGAGGEPDEAVEWSPALKRALAQSPVEISRMMVEPQGRVTDGDTLLNLMGRVSREAVRVIADADVAG